MTEDQNLETLTAKAAEPSAPQASPQKGNRWVKPLIWALALCLALCVGTVVGGGAVYGVMRVRDRLPVSARRPSVRFHFDCEGANCNQMPFEERRMPFFRDLPFEHGAVVYTVTEGSPASAAGLRPGDVITAIDGKAVTDARALSETVAGLEPGDEITLAVYRSEDGQARDVVVILGTHPDGGAKAYLGVQIGGSMHLGRR